MIEDKPIPNKDFEEELEAQAIFRAYFEYRCAFEEMMREKRIKNGQENIGKGM